MSKSLRRWIKIGLLAISLCTAVFAAPQVFAQLDDATQNSQEKEDGDQDVPAKIRKPKIHSKLSTTSAAMQTLRLKLGKDSFIDGYVLQVMGAQDDPYVTPTSNLAGGGAASFLLNGFTLTGGLDIKRNYTGTFGDWDGKLDKTYTLGVSRKMELSSQWTLTPGLKGARLVSDTATKELRKTDLSLPLSYALNKLWTLKVLTVAYSTQTFTDRVEDQTDKTWNISSGVAYKWSAKSTTDLSVSREERYSNQSSAEYSKTTVMSKYEYKFSPTSTVGIGIGYETHSNSTEQFSRWLLVPKVQIRFDI